MMWRMSEFHGRRLLSLCLLSLLFLTTPSPIASQTQVEHDDLTGVMVAVYNGTGVMPSSHIALTRMFDWMNASVVNVTASQILDDFLDDYDIIVVPGGSEISANIELGSEGKQKVKDFVANGGSYFGICGGATFGATHLTLFYGLMSPVNEPGGLIHMTTMNINQSSAGPDLSDFPVNCSTMYYGSQYFAPLPGASVHTIATYEYNDEAGMIACEYGNGTAFFSSPHPEYEEDGARDGTSDYDYLNDPDSEWELLFRVSKWLIEASIVEPSSSTATPTPTPIPTPTTNPLDLPMIAVASTGVAIVVLIVAVLYRRMR